MKKNCEYAEELGKRGGIESLGELLDNQANDEDEYEEEEAVQDQMNEVDELTANKSKKTKHATIKEQEEAIERDMKEYFDQLEEDDERVDYDYLDGS